MNKKIFILLISLFIFEYTINANDHQFLCDEYGNGLFCECDELVEEIKKSKFQIFASSTLKSKNNRYSVQNLFDKKKETCWCPVGNGQYHFIAVKIPYGVKGIKITNGLAVNKDLFEKNNRVKELFIGIVCENHEPVTECDLCGETKYQLIKNETYYLKDNPEPQVIDVNRLKIDIEGEHRFWDFNAFKKSKEFYLVISILSIYPGTKYNDTCISEIEIIK